MEPTIDIEFSKIYIGKGLLGKVGSYISKEFADAKVLIVTDKIVGALYLASMQKDLKTHGIKHYNMTFESGESTKSLKNIGFICETAAEFGLNRGDVILALGGGVVGDLAGFAAAIFLRGIKFLAVPTTLLSQVDSSVGGKTGVNLPQGKNLVGCFYKAHAVMIDTDTLKTLPDSEFECGMAEVIKHGIIKDKLLFEKLERLDSREKIMSEIDDIVTTNCKIKAAVVRQDEFDKGLRMILNFGHSIGHAIENANGYGALTHGQAVAIGMCKITLASERLGFTQKGTAQRLQALLKTHGLPTDIETYDKHKIFDAAMMDKKNIGKTMNIILAKTIGQVEITKINPHEMVKYL